MNRLARTAIALAWLAPAAAIAGHFDKPAPPLGALLAQAKAQGKPVLLDFSAVW